MFPPFASLFPHLGKCLSGSTYMVAVGAFFFFKARLSKHLLSGRQ